METATKRNDEDGAARQRLRLSKLWAVDAKWGGCCDDCVGWNAIVEETRQAVSIFGSMIIDDFKCVSGRG
ncbi:MAG TPA: hypothetical protein EYO23_09490 [Alphaproteobacteria bacterium]|nr:hypothetical protein [Alphaproteobacteria bacterium]